MASEQKFYKSKKFFMPSIGRINFGANSLVKGT